MRTLVAEDDRVASEALARTLKRWGCDVTVVADGRSLVGDSGRLGAQRDWTPAPTTT